MSAGALVSIHDVEPRRMERVLEIVRVLERAGVPPVTLLVVPGVAWSREDIAELRALVDGGHELAGHGWSHRAPPPRSWYHRLHADLISRDQGEHLSRTVDDVMARVRSCYAWFGEMALPSPELYVPPAWAMGPLTDDDLRALPFSWFEKLEGFVDPTQGIRRVLPLVGFDADTVARQVGLELWNRLNNGLARLTGVPVRIAIHPDDLYLRLAGRLREIVRRDYRFERTGAWLAGQTAREALPASAPPARDARR